MRREWILVMAVLIPFAALVVAALWITRPRPQDASPSAEASRRARQPEQVLTRRLAPAAETHAANGAGNGPGTDAGNDARTDAGSVAGEGEELRGGPLEAVRSEVRECFRDNGGHSPREVLVRVSFRAQKGRFGDVRIVAQSWQNPYVTACIEDVFQEMSYSALEGPVSPSPQEATFRFDSLGEGLRIER